MKNIYRFSTAGFVLCVAMVTLFATAGANAQGRYAARYSKSDVSNIISRLEQSSDTFRRDFDRQMDRSNLNGSQAEDRFNNIVRDFENSVDRLRSQFDSGDSWWESRNQVESMVRDSRPVNTMMTTLPFRRNLERQWNGLRSNVNTLADTYDLPGLNGGGWNGGGGGDGGGGGNTSTPPNWARGTFYSTSGSDTTLTINQNGTVSANVDGQTYYGTYFRNEIALNNDVSTVSRNGNGIRTYNRNTGQTTNYSRNNDGGGSGGGGNSSRPPDWARGTFYATNGSDIQLTINANGSVTANVGGQTFYGNYYQGSIVLNNDTSTVSRNGNGIRTYNRNTGQTTNYRRN